MKIAKEIAQEIDDIQYPTGCMTVLKLHDIIATHLEQVKKALEIAWNDGVCPDIEGNPRCQCPDCKVVSDALALFKEES